MADANLHGGDRTAIIDPVLGSPKTRSGRQPIRKA
jgi:hypothetical protein